MLIFLRKCPSHLRLWCLFCFWIPQDISFLFLFPQRDKVGVVLESSLSSLTVSHWGWQLMLASVFKLSERKTAWQCNKLTTGCKDVKMTYFDYLSWTQRLNTNYNYNQEIWQFWKCQMGKSILWPHHIFPWKQRNLGVVEGTPSLHPKLCLFCLVDAKKVPQALISASPSHPALLQLLKFHFSRRHLIF